MAGIPNSDAPVGDEFGFPSAGWYSTGLVGSPGIRPEPAGHGGNGVVGTPVVSIPFGSSQVAADMPTRPVTAGDTSSMSDDLAVHTSALIPPMSDVTGIGHGHAGDEYQ